MLQHTDYSVVGNKVQAKQQQAGSQCEQQQLIAVIADHSKAHFLQAPVQTHLASL
jgi:hypothetical protein